MFWYSWVCLGIVRKKSTVHFFSSYIYQTIPKYTRTYPTIPKQRGILWYSWVCLGMDGILYFFIPTNCELFCQGPAAKPSGSTRHTLARNTHPGSGRPGSASIRTGPYTRPTRASRSDARGGACVGQKKLEISLTLLWSARPIATLRGLQWSRRCLLYTSDAADE